MNEDTIRPRIRDKLRTGALPRDPGALASAAGLVHNQPCSACGEADPKMTLRYSIGGALYFHGLCYRIWDDERRRG